MAIQVDCPGCGKRYRVSDEKAGRTIRCKDCGEEIEISGKRRRSGAKQKESGMGPGLLIGGAFLGAAILGLLAFVMMKAPAPVPGNPVPMPAADNKDPPVVPV